MEDRCDTSAIQCYDHMNARMRNEREFTSVNIQSKGMDGPVVHQSFT